MKRNRTILIGGLLVLAMAFFLWSYLSREKPIHTDPAPPAEKEVIPPGIVVTESASPPPPPPAMFAGSGDQFLTGYGSPNLSPENDIKVLSETITAFLSIRKNAVERPLSANGEWSTALRGLRSGDKPWISKKSPVFDTQHHLVDRWSTPLHFHALGGKRWEIRSAGPDRKLWTRDDILGKFSG